MDTLEKIDRLRVQRGWSINNLAAEAMLTQSTLNNMYQRKNEPKLSTLRALCDAFGITLSEFFRDESVDSDIDVLLNERIACLTPTQKQALLSFLKTL